MAKSGKAQVCQFPHCPLQDGSMLPFSSHKDTRLVLNQCLLNQICQGKAAAHLDRGDSQEGYDCLCQPNSGPCKSAPGWALGQDIPGTDRHLCQSCKVHQRSRRSPPESPLPEAASLLVPGTFFTPTFPQALLNALKCLFCSSCWASNPCREG